MFYYSHHIGDFIKDTSNLDDHHLATYLRMMWVYYTEEKPLSDDVDDIAFAVRSDEKTVRLLLRHFFQKVGNEWHHNRCDREIAEYHGKSEKARNSANARWKNAKAMQTHSERNANEPVFNANQEPITNNQEPITKKEKKGASAEIVFPDGLDQMAWTRWVEYRKAAGKALRPVSWQSAIDALVKHGPNQMAVVEQSIANGWQGLFALKQEAVKAMHSDGTPLNKQEALEASNRAVVARFLAKEAQREAQ